MNTIRTFTLVSSVLAGLVAVTLPALAQDADNPDCSAVGMTKVSALVWDMDSETFVARVVDITPAHVAPATFTASVSAAPGPDANTFLDESLIGAGFPSEPARVTLDPGS